jgi:UDP-2,3-diacylglucosamine hydrolase
MPASSRPDAVLLISDLHLDPARPALCRAFFDFVASTAKGSAALYILGDFFDAWIGDDDDTPLYRGIAAALKQLADAGTAVYLMHGNRDFLLGEDYASACGATLIHEPFLLKHQGHVFVLLHGDQLCTRDHDYQQFRTMVRAPAWQAAFLALPLAERRAYATQARARSKSMSSNKAEDIMDVTPEAVAALMSNHAGCWLIHGHTHRPAVHEVKGGNQHCKRLVLGDWGELAWFARLDASGASLHSYPLST